MSQLRLIYKGQVRSDLAGMLRRSSELRAVHRLHAVLLVSLGYRCPEVAHWFGDSPRTVERWVRSYEAQGLDGLRDHHHGGRPGILTPGQINVLRSELGGEVGAAGDASPHWTGKLLARHLERIHGVAISLRQCQRLLKQLASDS